MRFNFVFATLAGLAGFAGVSVKAIHCIRKDILPPLNLVDFEPSDLAWDAKQKVLYVVNDGGTLVAVPQHYITDSISEKKNTWWSYFNGNQQTSIQLKNTDVKQWVFGQDSNFEGCAVDFDKTNIVYLGVEFPPKIITFDVNTGETISEFDLGSIFDEFPVSKTSKQDNHKKDKKLSSKKKAKKNNKNKKKKKKNGLEALGFLRAGYNEPGYLLVGRQDDARVFLLSIDETKTKFELKGTLLPPGPHKDLSAISVFQGRIFFVYDKEYEADSVLIQDFFKAIETKTPILLKRVERYTFDKRGQEGLTFTYSDFSCSFTFNDTSACSDIDITPVIYAIDPPKRGSYKKQLQVGEYGHMRSCWLQQ